MLPKSRANGGNAMEAKCVCDASVDVVVAQGWEAGGHMWGQVDTHFAL